MQKLSITDLNKKDILIVLKKFKLRYDQEGLKIIGLFGSYAKGGNDSYSDIDIAYEIDKQLFSKKYHDGFSKILRIEEVKGSIEKALHRKVDFVSLQSNNQQFIDQVRGEMIYV